MKRKWRAEWGPSETKEPAFLVVLVTLVETTGCMLLTVLDGFDLFTVIPPFLNRAGTSTIIVV